MSCESGRPGLDLRSCALIIYRVEDKSVRYVAEENIDSTPVPVGTNLMSLAGRHFKRWDNVSEFFVSNIRDEYPND